LKISRREIREKALQALFQIETNRDLDKDEAIQNALNSNQENQEEMDELLPVPEYLDELVSGVLEHQEEIDRMITKHLRNWSIKRLAKTDLLILRIGVYELLYQQETPANVVMNEAIEITKEYSDEDASKFVNGVLSSVHRTTPKEAE